MWWKNLLYIGIYDFGLDPVEYPILGVGIGVEGNIRYPILGRGYIYSKYYI